MGMNGKREENKNVCDFHVFFSSNDLSDWSWSDMFFVLEYYESKLNNSYYLDYFCDWFLYSWKAHKLSIILMYVVNILLYY